MEDGCRTSMYAYKFVNRRCVRSIVESTGLGIYCVFFFVRLFVWKALVILIKRLAAGSHVNASLFKWLSSGKALVSGQSIPVRCGALEQTRFITRFIDRWSAFPLLHCTCVRVGLTLTFLQRHRDERVLHRAYRAGGVRRRVGGEGGGRGLVPVQPFVGGRRVLVDRRHRARAHGGGACVATLGVFFFLVFAFLCAVSRNILLVALCTLSKTTRTRGTNVLAGVCRVRVRIDIVHRGGGGSWVAARYSVAAPLFLRGRSCTRLPLVSFCVVLP